MSGVEVVKPTPGPWSTKKNGFNGCAVVAGNGVWITYVAGEHQKSSTQEANARLIAEAGTVHHETGKTPRQLVEANASFREANVSLADDNAALRLEVERLRADAVRYRFLRKDGLIWRATSADDIDVIYDQKADRTIDDALGLAQVNDDELPGLWSYADFTGGDPDERSYAERNRAKRGGES